MMKTADRMDFTFDLDSGLFELIDQGDFKEFDSTDIGSDLLSDSAGADIDKAGMEGIQAQDVNSLLEQFEEASLLDGFSCSNGNATALSSRSLPSSRACSAASSPCNTPPPTPPPSVLDKIRSRHEQTKTRGSTIMLPMGAPSRRGRGRASTFAQAPFNSPSSRLQRILSRADSFPKLPVSQPDVLPESNQSLSDSQLQSTVNPSADGQGKQLQSRHCSKAMYIPQPLALPISCTWSSAELKSEELPSSCHIATTATSIGDDHLADMRQSKMYSQKQIMTVMTRAEGIPAEVLDSVMDHDYCANSPRRVVVDEFELATSPTKLKHGSHRPLHKVQSLPALKLEGCRQATSVSQMQPAQVSQNASAGQTEAVHLGSRGVVEKCPVLSRTSRGEMVSAQPLDASGCTSDTVLRISNHIQVPSQVQNQPAFIDAPAGSSAQVLRENKVASANPEVEDIFVASAEEKMNNLNHVQKSTDQLCSVNKFHRSDSTDERKEQESIDGERQPSGLLPSKKCVSPPQCSGLTTRLDVQEHCRSDAESKVEGDGHSVPSSETAGFQSDATTALPTLSADPKQKENLSHFFTPPPNTEFVSDHKHLDSCGEGPLKLPETLENAGDNFVHAFPLSPVGDISAQRSDKPNDESVFSNLSDGAVIDDVDNKLVQKKVESGKFRWTRTVSERRRRGGRCISSSRRGRQSYTCHQEKDWKFGNSPIREDASGLFDKIPSYYTALVIPTKTGRKELTAEGLLGSGLSVADLIPPDHSPPRSASSEYNKLPAYHTCFTNSTKYDGMTGDENFQSLGSPEPCTSRSGEVSRSGSCSPERSRPKSRSRKRSFNQDRSRSSSSSSKSPSRSGRGWKRRRSRSSSSQSSGWSSMSRSLSTTSSSSRSRSRSGSRSPSASRSLSEKIRLAKKLQRQKEKIKKMEERKIVYVGKIPDGYTRSDLRKRFERFGKIEEVSVHFREARDNYGFVTFFFSCDAYNAIDKGNGNPNELHFDLCFGGRRHFCANDYADLDGNHVLEEGYGPMQPKDPVGFDELLKQAQQKLKK